MPYSHLALKERYGIDHLVLYVPFKFFLYVSIHCIDRIDHIIKRSQSPAAFAINGDIVA